MKKSILLVFVAVVGIGVYYFLTRNNVASISQVSNETQNVSPAPSSPFQELTIPYLRQRHYQSSLGELELVGQSNQYSSYVTHYDSDGLRINALLTKPKGVPPKTGWPAVVFVHGYIPPTLYKTTERYTDYVNYLASNGLVVMKIDLRGHGESEGDPSGAYYSSDYIIDTLNAYAALQQSDFVNPNSIGLWGHSMAGNVVMRALAAQPTIPAAVIWGGAVYTYQDLADLGIDDDSYRPPAQVSERQRQRQLLLDTYGQFKPESEFWKTVVPTNYLKDITGAIQLHHADDDVVVSPKYSQNVYKLLQEAGVTSELFSYQQGGHNILGASFSQAMQRTVSFYKEHLN